MIVQKSDNIYVAGHRGMVGSAVIRRLKDEGFENLIVRTSSELDLRNQGAVTEFMAQERPDVVVDAAARVGGILANDTYPYTFLRENLVIQNNLIHAAHENEVRKFVFLGSSCIYPKHADQPMKEDSLLTGPLEPTNQWYAIAKIAGVKMCESLRIQHGRDYVSLMPTNLYGRGDNFDLETSHVLPAMIRKFHDAVAEGHRPVTLWGSGSPRREFLHVDDVADAILFTLQNEMEDHLYNVGTGKEISIAELAKLIQSVSGHEGEIVWDRSRPDGTPRKLMDVSKMREEGWEYRIELKEGIERTYDWFKENRKQVREVHF